MSILSIVAAAINLNMSNFTRDGIIKVAFNPYVSIFGNMTWGIILGFIGAGLYANERSLATIVTYLVLVGMFFAIILPSPIVAILSLILIFAVTVILYKTFVEAKE